MTTETKLYTIEEAVLLDPYDRWELVRGRIVPMSRPQRVHVIVAGFLCHILFEFGARTGRGWAGPEYGFITETGPDTLRDPDCIFISHERDAQNDQNGWLRVAPELAIEVKSPSNSRTELFAKAVEYLAAGTDRVWIVDAEQRTIRVYRSADRFVDLGVGDVLRGDGVLDGLVVAVADIVDQGRRPVQ